MTTAEMVVIRESPWKIGLMFAGAIFVLAISIDMILHPVASFRRSAEWIVFMGVVTAILAGAALVIRAVRIFKPGELVLTPLGFILRLWPKATALRWTDVSEFLVWRERGLSLAAWKLRLGAKDPGFLTQARGKPGFDGLVGNGWRRPPDEIVALLEEWRDRYGSVERNTSNGSVG